MNPSWMRLSQTAWWLAWDASGVIAMRMMRIAAGGRLADRETYRMVEEKLKAAFTLQSLAMMGALGFTPSEVASKTLAHYARAVKANHRRLLKHTRQQ